MSCGKPFLTHPDLLPTDLRGRRWGQRSIVLEVAGERYRFSGLSSAQIDALRPVYGWRSLGKDARETTETATIDSVILRADPTNFHPLEDLDWQQVIDVDYAPGVVRASSYRWMARIEWPAAVRGALWTTFEDGVAFTDLFENYFRILVAYQLLTKGHLLVHSAAIASPEGAFIFPGASGDGKSTLSKLALAEGRMVLSDDSNALLHTADGQRIMALPFGGELRHRRPPVDAFAALGLATLAKGEAHRVEALSRNAAIGQLMASAPFVNGDPHRREALFQTAERLTHELATYRLTFAKRGGFWPMLHPARIAS